MDNLQFGALLATLGRIGDALEQHNMLLMASQSDRAAPKLQRSLEAYAGFDWPAIGAQVLATDRFGATEVEWGNRVFVRRRSAEDDDKGEDIRFSRVASGTVAEQNIRWETLIKFGGSHKPAKPLRGDIADKVAAAAATAAQSAATTTVAVAPPPQKPASPASPTTPPAAPSAPEATAASAPTAKPASRTQHVDDQHAEAAKAYRERFNVADIPGHLVLAWDDTLAAVEQKIAALTRMATTGDQWGHHDAPADRTVPAPPPSANESIEIGPAEQARTEIASQVKRNGSRMATSAQHAEVAAALKTHGLEWEQFCRLVWDRAAADVTAGWVLGTHSWLRPARNKTATFAANPTAREIIKALAEAVPA
jgi:hypothetical protein